MSDYYSTTLDDLPLFRRSDPDTSRAAGTRARQFRGQHELLILAALEHGPGTKDELSQRCGLTEQQVIRRMAVLVRRGLVVDTGERRASRNGCAERVWKATAASR